jgi:excisionase family DNA binding protein
MYPLLRTVVSKKDLPAVMLARVAINDGCHGRLTTHMDGKLMLRPAEAAEAIGVSRSKAYELISSGVIPSVRLGGSLRVPVEALRTWISEQIQQAKR